MSPRRFPFGHEAPAAPPRPLRVQRTAPLDDFAPPTRVLPFDAPSGRGPVNHKTLPLPAAPPRELPSRPVEQTDPPPVLSRLWVAVALLVLAIDAVAVWLIAGRW